jgi:hypothetical protein
VKSWRDGLYGYLGPLRSTILARLMRHARLDRLPPRH